MFLYSMYTLFSHWLYVEDAPMVESVKDTDEPAGRDVDDATMAELVKDTNVS